LLFKSIFFAKNDAPFVMELPPYRIPTLRNTSIHMWGKSVQYLTKMGTTILVASILIWALGYFPRQVTYSKNYDSSISSLQKNALTPDSLKQKEIKALEAERQAEHLEKSYIGKMGKALEPVIQPLGFDWKIGVSILTGLASKEIVIGTMGVLYQNDFSVDKSSADLHTKLQQQTYTSGPKIGQNVFSPLVAFSLMVFILVYFPCVAVNAAIKRESNWKWSLFTMIYTTVLAWFLAFGVYQIGSYIM